MDVLEEAKEIMKEAGCKKAFAVYGLELNNLTVVKECDENGECIELENDISDLQPTIERELVFDPDRPIECPLNSSMDKYLEFSLKNRSITPCNVTTEECKSIEDKINPLLERYNWSIKKNNVA